MKIISLTLGCCILLSAGIAAATGSAPSAPVPEAPAAGPAADLKEKLAVSEKAWQKWREDCKGNYEYDVCFQSWTGASNTTTIVVRDNKVVGRKFEERSGRPSALRPIEPGKQPTVQDDATRWEEKGAEELGKNRGGAPAKTIDQLYREAAALLEKGIDNNQRWTTLFHPNGIIRVFGYTDLRIMDDAPLSGVRIDAVRPAVK
jgi:hypothetical protein